MLIRKFTFQLLEEKIINGLISSLYIVSITEGVFIQMVQVVVHFCQFPDFDFFLHKIPCCMTFIVFSLHLIQEE